MFNDFKEKWQEIVVQRLGEVTWRTGWQSTVDVILLLLRAIAAALLMGPILGYVFPECGIGVMMMALIVVVLPMLWLHIRFLERYEFAGLEGLLVNMMTTLLVLRVFVVYSEAVILGMVGDMLQMTIIVFCCILSFSNLVVILCWR